MPTAASGYVKPREVSAKERKEFYDWYSVVSQQLKVALKQPVIAYCGCHV